MRSEKQRRSARLMLLPGGVGQEKSGSASTISGCESPGGTTSHRIQLALLSGSLNELERQVEALESKYYEALDMWLTATTHLVRLSPIIIDTATTDE